MIGTIIVLCALLGSVAMAANRRRRRRWNPNNRVVAIAVETGLSTLVDQGVLKAALTVSADEEYRAISLKCSWSIRDVTAGQGPVHFGVAYGDYDATEIKEYLEATQMMVRGNKIATEQGNRQIRRIGTFSNGGTEEVLNDGKAVHTKLNWHIPSGRTLTVWAQQQSGAPLTTGQLIVTHGTMFMRWGQ